jgi:hypothetical protein
MPHHPLVGTAGSTNGNECLALSGHEGKHFLHHTLSEGHQVQIAVQGNIREGALPGSGIDANIQWMRGKHGRQRHVDKKENEWFYYIPEVKKCLRYMPARSIMISNEEVENHGYAHHPICTRDMRVVPGKW